MAELSLFELAIIIFIMLGIGVALWRGGNANPESTGRLARKIGGLDSRLSHVEREVSELKTECATVKDIETVRAEMKGDRELADRTFKAVKRIEDMLIERSLRAVK